MSLKSFAITALIVLALLTVPAIAMQYTEEVRWTAGDFIAMGILLFSTALMLHFIWKKATSTSGRILFSLLAIAVFGLIWVELAVGFF